MSSNTIISEQQQYNMESRKKDLYNDMEDQKPDETPSGPSFLMFWLVFILGTIAMIVCSNWTIPEASIHATQQPNNSSSSIASGTSPHVSSPTSTCSSLALRQEWQALSNGEQIQYQRSVRCLMDIPSASGSGSRYNDFIQTYLAADWQTSELWEYLPWNRWFLHTFKTALRRECAYTGDMPYFDWTQTVEDAVMSIGDVTSPGTSSHSTLHEDPVREDADSEQKWAATTTSKILSSANYHDFIKALKVNAQDLATINIPLLDLLQDPLFQHQAQLDRL